MPEEPSTGVEEQVRRFGPWLLAAVAALVLVTTAVLVIGDDQQGRADNGNNPLPSPPPSASTPGPPASEQPGGSATPLPTARTWQVGAALDGTTLRLTNGVDVRLAGIEDGCATLELARLVVGKQVTLIRRGPDKDAEGRLLRYADYDGLDVGKRLLQRGWASATDDANARRAIYRRVDARSPDACGRIRQIG